VSGTGAATVSQCVVRAIREVADLFGGHRKPHGHPLAAVAMCAVGRDGVSAHGFSSPEGGYGETGLSGKAHAAAMPSGEETVAATTAPEDHNVTGQSRLPGAPADETPYTHRRCVGAVLQLEDPQSTKATRHMRCEVMEMGRASKREEIAQATQSSTGSSGDASWVTSAPK
jgi:hypothetical protein